MIDKIIVNGSSSNHQHQLDVLEAFKRGYECTGETWTGQVVIYEDKTIQNTFQYAVNNDIKVIIYSYVGMTSNLSIASQYPKVLMFQPAGSNDNTLLYTGDIPTSICITGAGTTTNVTAYKVEFFDEDIIAHQNRSSYANGYIAGKICLIANKLNISLSQARTIAQYTASKYNNRTDNDGFGKIDITKALSTVLTQKIYIRTVS